MKSGPEVVIESQNLAIALGIGGLLFAKWAFDQAWEKRGHTRPGVARWLAI